ncbi:MAG TPA: alpha/beta hydrolase-fold protein [Planctomycetota bacterium]|nr:alpha/beta hydrolase-fold protein [Planctomycetota bacterium]
MTSRIEAFIEGRGPGDGSLDAFLAEQTFPIVEGDRVTFAWRGRADSVTLWHAIFGLPPFPPLARVAGTDLWYLTIDLPPGSRMEYKLRVERGGEVRLLRDPLNPKLAHDPYGANSVAYGEGYVRPDWTLEDPEARPGTLEDRDFDSAALGGPRTVHLYLPARMRMTRRYPLLVVHDGFDYLRFAGLKVVLDNLIHRLEIPPIVAACTQSPDRSTEYIANPAHARFVVEELIPALEGMLPLQRDPAARGLLGASLGGVASLYAAWRYPRTFGRLLLQSGSFAFTDIGRSQRGPMFDPVASFVNAFRAKPGRPAEKVFLSCGVYESLIYENRSMAPFLERAGMEVRFVESRDGHTWENWRDRLREGLSWLFPGPLWMIYE